MAQHGRSNAGKTKRKHPERAASASSSESEGLLQPIDIRDSDAATSSDSDSDSSTGGSSRQDGSAAVAVPSAGTDRQQPPQKTADERAHQEAAAQRDAPARSAPTLPWMRVPIAVGGGASVPLAQVKGLHPQLCTALEAGTSPSLAAQGLHVCLSCKTYCHRRSFHLALVPWQVASRSSFRSKQRRGASWPAATARHTTCA